MRFILISLAATLIVSCATETTPPPEPAAPAKLSDAAFQDLYDSAYSAEPEAASEPAFTELLARDDLTETQRGKAHVGRGTLRGIYVRDWPQAFPQCALGDFLDAFDYPLPDNFRELAGEGIIYQYDRRIYFNDAPAECAPNVSDAQTWLAENRALYE